MIKIKIKTTAPPKPRKPRVPVVPGRCFFASTADFYSSDPEHGIIPLTLLLDPSPLFRGVIMKTQLVALALIIIVPASTQCAVTPSSDVLAPAVSVRQYLDNGFAPIVEVNTTTRMNNTQILYVEPLRIKVTLPWWTSVIGGTISFLLTLKSVTWDWFRNRRPPAWTFSSPSSIIFLFGIASTFVQNFALLCTILQGATSHQLGMITPVTGNAYLALFEAAAALWTARMFEFKIARVAGWTNVCFALFNFVLLSLPFIGTAGLYQAYSPHCTSVIASGDASMCGFYYTQASGNCSSSLDQLQLGTGTSLNNLLSQTWINYANWGYAGSMGLLLLLTMRAHWYYVKRWKRLGATGGLHEKVEVEDVPEGNAGRIEVAQNKIQSSWMFAGSLYFV
jgi:hypothetical protein